MVPQNFCAEIGVIEAAREKLRKGASHVHVITDLLLGLEGEDQSLKDEGVNPAEVARREAITSYAETSADELDEALSAAVEHHGFQRSD